MEPIQGKYFLRGNDLREVYEFNGSFIEDGTNIYEVVRVIDGIILFLEDHLQRLYNSAIKSGLRPFVEYSEINKLLKRLINSNHLQNGNIKIVFHYGKGDWAKTFKAYPIPFIYPTDEDYRTGVKTGIFQFTRPTPEIKAWFGEFRLKVNQAKQDNAWFETILQNENGIITEGSQSNIFLIKKNKIFSSPLNLVLEGITRKKIIAICNSENLVFEEKIFDRDFLFTADTVFLTGTSLKVLPVSQIDEKLFSVNHPILLSLMDKYNQMISAYIKEKIDVL